LIIQKNSIQPKTQNFINCEIKKRIPLIESNSENICNNLNNCKIETLVIDNSDSLDWISSNQSIMDSRGHNRKISISYENNLKSLKGNNSQDLDNNNSFEILDNENSISTKTNDIQDKENIETEISFNLKKLRKSIIFNSQNELKPLIELKTINNKDNNCSLLNIEKKIDFQESDKNNTIEIVFNPEILSNKNKNLIIESRNKLNEKFKNIKDLHSINNEIYYFPTISSKNENEEESNKLLFIKENLKLISDEAKNEYNSHNKKFIYLI